MKILLEHNYNQFNTRQLYLNHLISSLPDVECSLRNTNLSFYDSMDMFSPDLYILDAQMMSDDTIKFLIDNKNIAIAIGISDIVEKHAQQLDAIIKDNKINCKLYFSNKFNHIDYISKLSRPIFKLMEGFDEGLDGSEIHQPQYSFPNYTYIDEPNGLYSNDFELFHSLTCMPFSSNKKIDISLNCMLMSKLLQNYDHGLFYLGEFIPQMFFHSIMHNKKTSFYSSDEKSTKKIDGILRKIFDLDDDTTMIHGKNNCDQLKVREKIKEKHSGLNRMRRLLSQLQGGSFSLS